jgi:hypothetical protein
MWNKGEKEGHEENYYGYGRGRSTGVGGEEDKKE